MSTKRKLKPGIYYHPVSLKMIETIWIDEDKITFWTWHCMKTGKGYIATSIRDYFEKYLVYLGAV